ncbi:unnamed protein product [Sphenostylis stenocarpa]|uniref:Uncharacterized protein n=1 Tax=Sphenostylis stenocarpa TaxID=92480 RepID=A0AA86SZ91_9FABA|nr:unnamed protein product [Sphenostylis stenocarpa]
MQAKLGLFLPTASLDRWIITIGVISGSPLGPTVSARGSGRIWILRSTAATSLALESYTNRVDRIALISHDIYWPGRVISTV